MTTVPRIAMTAFGVLISITSPGFINPLATATAMRPAPRLIVATPGTSVIVRTDRSRAVTVALPPSSTRTSDRSPVVIRSRRNRSSLNCSGRGSGSETRATVASPSMVVTTPTRSWARVEDASSRAAAPVSSKAVITRLTRLMSLSCRRHISVAWVRPASAERAREMPLNSRISEKSNRKVLVDLDHRLRNARWPRVSQCVSFWPDWPCQTPFRILAFVLESDYARVHSRTFASEQRSRDMSLRAMSADSHMDLIYLPPDTFTSRMPSTWGDRTPRVVERDGRKVWVSGDAVLGPWGVYGPGVTGGRRGRILAEAGFASGTQTRPSNPIERRQGQERDGVEAEVIYGIIGISRGLFTHSGIADHETLAAVYRAYNDYIADFNRSQPGRFFGLGCLPNHDARAAADEVRHCAELGLRGAVFVPWGSALPVWHQMWEPLWTAAEETGLVISFHVFEGGAATVGYAVQNIQHPAAAGL